jgi:adenylate kinase
MSAPDAAPDDPPLEPSTISVFVHWADSYVGQHLVGVLQEANYTVYGNRRPSRPFETPNYWPIPDFEVVRSVNDAFALCNTFVFDIREDPGVALRALPLFESATTKVKVVLISTLMTWALTPASGQLTGDDFRKRRPHPRFKMHYETELKVMRLCRENPLIDLYILSCGILYGCGEELLFPLFKFAWGLQYNESAGLRSTVRSVPLIGAGENSVPMIHVRDLAQLMISTLNGQMIDRFVMAVDRGNNKLRDVVEAIAKVFTSGQYEKVAADHALTLQCVTGQLIDHCTADIAAVNELFGRVKSGFSAGFAASIEQVKAEFLDAHGVHPLRILICGPPLSGKTYVASAVSYCYSLPLITVDSVVAEARKNDNNYWAHFSQQVQGEIAPSLLLELVKWKLQEIRCKNQGFVLDGIPSNSDFAEALWQDTTNWPQMFIELEANDAFLRDRARQDPSMMLGIGNTDEFEGRLAQYRAMNPWDDTHLFYSFDPTSIRALTINVEKHKDNLFTVLAKWIGRPHNFGKPPSLILRDREEMVRQKRLKEERLAKIGSDLREAEEAKKREKELMVLRQRELVEQEETRLLARFSKPQREWLVKAVAPTLAEGLCYVIKEMPDDPIQLLGCFVCTKLPREQQAELAHEFQPEEEEEDGYEEEDEAEARPRV